MKSKTTVYLLIVAVLTVWGIIAWKLFAPAGQTVADLAAPPVARPTTIRDHDVLHLDYPDPFLKETGKAAASVRPDARKNDPKPDIASRIKKECKIKYIGYMRRGKAPGYIVEYHGMHYSVKKGEEIDSFRLAKIFPDSLVFVKKGFSYTVRRLP